MVRLILVILAGMMYTLQSRVTVRCLLSVLCCNFSVLCGMWYVVCGRYVYFGFCVDVKASDYGTIA
jgi:hypothetical protein